MHLKIIGPTPDLLALDRKITKPNPAPQKGLHPRWRSHCTSCRPSAWGCSNCQGWKNHVKKLMYCNDVWLCCDNFLMVWSTIKWWNATFKRIPWACPAFHLKIQYPQLGKNMTSTQHKVGKFSSPYSFASKEQIEIVVQQVELVLDDSFFPTRPTSYKTSMTKIAPALPKSRGKGSGHTPPCPRWLHFGIWIEETWIRREWLHIVHEIAKPKSKV